MYSVTEEGRKYIDSIGLDGDIIRLSYEELADVITQMIVITYDTIYISEHNVIINDIFIAYRIQEAPHVGTD